jgi:hypothetical protein
MISALSARSTTIDSPVMAYTVEPTVILTVSDAAPSASPPELSAGVPSPPAVVSSDGVTRSSVIDLPFIPLTSPVMTDIFAALSTGWLLSGDVLSFGDAVMPLGDAPSLFGSFRPQPVAAKSRTPAQSMDAKFLILTQITSFLQICHSPGNLFISQIKVAPSARLV